MTPTIEKLDTFDKLLVNYELYKLLRMTAWIKKFINNCYKTKLSGPLETEEIEH